MRFLFLFMTVMSMAFSPKPTEKNIAVNYLPIAKDILEGRHILTIQWLTYEKNKPGIATIKKTATEWYSIEGQQQNAQGFLKISGKIKTINPKTLIFDGVIIYKIKYLNDGLECKKEGQQTFLSTLNRKYWRMQNMVSCEGGTTDYIDIFF